MKVDRPFSRTFARNRFFRVCYLNNLVVVYYRVERIESYRDQAARTEESRIGGHKVQVIARSLALDVPVGRVKLSKIVHSVTISRGIGS